MRIPRHFWRDRYLHLARMVPPKLRYWVYVVCVAEATTGEYGDTVVPEVTAMTVLQRLSF